MARKFDIFSNPYYQQFQATSQGALAGSKFGPYGAAAGAVLGGVGNLASNVISQQSAINRIAPNVPSQQTDQFGRPIYNLGSTLTEFDGTNNYGKGLAKQGLMIGGAGALAGGILGNRLKRKANEQITEGRNRIQAAQQQYNQQSQNFNQGYLARQQYEDQFR